MLRPSSRETELLAFEEAAEELWVVALVVTPVKILISHGAIMVVGGVGETWRRIILESVEKFLVTEGALVSIMSWLRVSALLPCSAFCHRCLKKQRRPFEITRALCSQSPSAWCLL